MLVIADLRDYFAKAILRDGTPICIRAIRPDDKGRLADHFDRLSTESRYYRFFGFRKALTPHELGYFAEPDFLGHAALVATINKGHSVESIVGDGRYVALPDRRYAAEMALSVVDAYQRRGIGTLLLEHLIRLARHAGVRRLEANVLVSNWQALRLLSRRGFKSSGTAGGVCCVALSMEDRGGGLSLTVGQPSVSSLPRASPYPTSILAVADCGCQSTARLYPALPDVARCNQARRRERLRYGPVASGG